MFRILQDGKVDREVRTFKTVTRELLALSEWLAGHGCTHIVMEATGIYWRPVWHILGDGEFPSCCWPTPRTLKNVPGRKTRRERCDVAWLRPAGPWPMSAAASCPDDQTQELRGLLRTRKQLIRERSSHTLRLQKTLEDANIKLDSVITDIVGLSGRRMIEALVAGESDLIKLAQLAHPQSSRPRRRSYAMPCAGE